MISKFDSNIGLFFLETPPSPGKIRANNNKMQTGLIGYGNLCGESVKTKQGYLCNAVIKQLLWLTLSVVIEINNVGIAMRM